MKRKVLHKICASFAVAFLLILTLVSCGGKKDVVYYGYFGDSALMVIYSQEKNTLYEINVPMVLITSYAESTGETNIPAAMRSLSGLNPDGFMLGTPQVLTALREILDALDSSSAGGTHTPQQRIETFVEKSYLLKNEALLNNINTLCNTDFSALSSVVQGQPDVAYFDAQSFLNPDDLDFSRKYFRSWLLQVIS